MNCIARIRYVYLLLKQWPLRICIWYAPRVQSLLSVFRALSEKTTAISRFLITSKKLFLFGLGLSVLFCIEYQSQLFRLTYMVRQLMKARWATLPPLTTDLKVFSNWNQLRVSWVDDDPIQHTNLHIHFSYIHKHLVQIRPPRNSNHYSRLIRQIKHLVTSNL